MTKQYLVRYTVTEVTTCECWVSSDTSETGIESEADAIAAVESYGFDNSGETVFDSQKWEITNARVVDTSTTEAAA